MTDHPQEHNTLTLPIEIGKQYVRRDGKIVTAEEPANPRLNIWAHARREDQGESWYVLRHNGSVGMKGPDDGDIVADYPQEHESLDAFVAKVEASGEDKKHEPFAWISEMDHDRYMRSAHLQVKPGIALGKWMHRTDVAIYTQAQRDAYAAEAVKQERERLRERWADFAEEYRGDAIQALWIANAIRKDQP